MPWKVTTCSMNIILVASIKRKIISLTSMMGCKSGAREKGTGRLPTMMLFLEMNPRILIRNRKKIKTRTQMLFGMSNGPKKRSLGHLMQLKRKETPSLELARTKMIIRGRPGGKKCKRKGLSLTRNPSLSKFRRSRS